MKRLGGEYYQPEEGGALGEAYAPFLHAVERLCPEVLKSLRDEVRESLESLEDEDLLSFWRSEDRYPDELILEAWAERFNINVPWILGVANDTLEVWWKHPDTMEPLQWMWWLGPGYPRACAWLELRTAPFTFGGEAWLPIKERRQVFVERTRAAFERELGAYVEGIGRLAQDAGLEKTPEKRKLVHFDWLVHYQVQGWSMRKIADHYSGEGVLSEDTIAKGVRQAAKLVGLKLRPPRKGGRPKGKPPN
ncbi:MAG TPA: hypothetical protein DCM14_02090 [Clostridiales bacterium UBA8153]|nr:hypothetical protein [Clostridiales bacterium UBA8153]